jgi:hypothetical protein
MTIFGFNTGIFQACSSQCLDCSPISPFTCTSCRSGFVLKGTKCVSSNTVSFGFSLLPSFAGWSTATTFSARRTIFFANWSWFRFSLARLLGGIFILKPWLLTIDNLTDDGKGGVVLNGLASVEAGTSSSSLLSSIQTNIATGTIENVTITTTVFTLITIIPVNKCTNTFSGCLSCSPDASRCTNCIASCFPMPSSGKCAACTTAIPNCLSCEILVDPTTPTC